MEAGSAYGVFGHWGMLAITLGFVAFIVVGGLWLKGLERKTRDREKPLEPRD